jgi:PTS system mannose-specific IIA component
MTGLVVVAHFNLAREMVAATELIVGEQEQFIAVDIFPSDPVEKTKEKIISALKSSDTGDGVIILTDMFGGTPSNISLSSWRRTASRWWPVSTFPCLSSS